MQELEINTSNAISNMATVKKFMDNLIKENVLITNKIDYRLTNNQYSNADEKYLLMEYKKDRNSIVEKVKTIMVVLHNNLHKMATFNKILLSGFDEKKNVYDYINNVWESKNLFYNQPGLVYDDAGFVEDENLGNDSDIEPRGGHLNKEMKAKDYYFKYYESYIFHSFFEKLQLRCNKFVKSSNKDFFYLIFTANDFEFQLYSHKNILMKVHNCSEEDKGNLFIEIRYCYDKYLDDWTVVREIHYLPAYGFIPFSDCKFIPRYNNGLLDRFEVRKLESKAQKEIFNQIGDGVIYIQGN